MKIIISMIALIAVFSSSNVMADACSDAVATLNAPFKMSQLTSLCRTYQEAKDAVIGAANNGYTFVTVSNSVLPNQAATCHTNKVPPCTKYQDKDILVNSSGANSGKACGGGTMSVALEYGMLHELWHAATGPGSGEFGAISNTNKIRKGEGRIQRADHGATCY